MAWIKEIEGGGLEYHASLPNPYKNYPVFTEATRDISLINAEGFFKLVNPTIDSSTQKYGARLSSAKVGNDYILPVITKTTEEIQQQKIAESNILADIQLKELEKKIALSDLETSDISEQIKNTSVYPLWFENDIVEIDTKRKHFDANNELVLWKCVQAHTTQLGWEPKDTPALWVRVAEQGEVINWVQPTGAHDAYNTGDKVIYPSDSGTIWESTVDANVFAPGVVQGQWIEEV